MVGDFIGFFIYLFNKFVLRICCVLGIVLGFIGYIKIVGFDFGSSGEVSKSFSRGIGYY